MSDRRAIIIGAGPAGLTAAYELLTTTDIRPIVLEKSTYMGGISRTVDYKGNRIDIGGHRFFSKSDRVMSWWLDMLPMQADGPATVSYQNKQREVVPAAQPNGDDERVMLLRERRSRIYYMRRFFDYPLQLSADTVRKLGLGRTARIGVSYTRAALFPIPDEQNLEQFFVNRFGRQLYRTFFKDYTEKVWGVPCTDISAEWGAQRIKGLSVRKALAHAVRSQLRGRRAGDVAQKETETSLIEQFLYPKYGPGQMWEEVARRVKDLGGTILTEHDVDRVVTEGRRVVAIEATDRRTGERHRFEGEHFFSTMPMRELVRGMSDVPDAVREVAEGLVYRDFLTVGLLCEDLLVHEQTPEGKRLVRDNWIYVQEPDVQVGRLQIFNNWSPYMVADRSKVWIGLEYFCYETDDLWARSDEGLIALAKEELARIGIVDPKRVLDATVIRMPKTYPAYFGAYDRFPELRAWLDGVENLWLVGRNGMHKYNNQDHSMLTAMVAVENIAAGRHDKTNVWDVNTEQEYHEEKATS